MSAKKQTTRKSINKNTTRPHSRKTRPRNNLTSKRSGTSRGKKIRLETVAGCAAIALASFDLYDIFRPPTAADFISEWKRNEQARAFLRQAYLAHVSNGALFAVLAEAVDSITRKRAFRSARGRIQLAYATFRFFVFDMSELPKSLGVAERKVDHDALMRMVWEVLNDDPIVAAEIRTQRNNQTLTEWKKNERHLAIQQYHNYRRTALTYQKTYESLQQALLKQSPLVKMLVKTSNKDSVLKTQSD